MPKPKPPLEIHINTRGCRKPLDRRTMLALAHAMRACYDHELRRQAEVKRAARK